MNIEQAKASLERFLGDKVLSFAITTYPDGEWVAVCNEIPAIMTGGMGIDIAEMDKMIRDAILTAAGINTEFADQVLKFVNISPKSTRPTITNLFRSPMPTRVENREAEYVVA